MKINNIHKTIGRYVLLLMLISAICACSTRKNNGLNRAYHNLTSKFNVNFNGQEALKKGEEEYKKICKDNFIITLPIYCYPAKEELSSIYPSMDRVIEKASKSIYKHSMFFKGKEYVKPIDDAYLMMGKAYFYKQDYVQAQRIFSYITTTHKNGNCLEEAMIWQVRCAVRQKYYTRADEIINETKYYVQPKKSKKLNLLYAAAGAEYELTNPAGDLETATDYIEDVLKNKPQKDFKIRMHFILGQLYEKLEQPATAHDHFMYVAKKSNSYEMEFNARMHLATNYDGSPQRRATIVKELEKMVKDPKNEDYLDQIYYALSEINRIDEDTTARMENLAKSVATHKENDYQQTYSSLQLADLFFEKEKYPQAKAYYDTATIAMPKTYPNYEAIKQKSLILTELVDNLQLVIVQDSLQRIAKMSETERNRWIKSKIAAYKEEKTRKEKEERDKELALQSALGYTNYNQLNNSGNSGKWYFYNSTLMAAGKTEFLRKWGTRKLQDNWRISNKQQISFEDLANLNNPNAETDTTEYDEDGNPILKRETDPKKERFYTQDLPLTPGAIDTSNQLIAEAIYQAAIIYFDLLNDVPRGLDMLDRFYQRFPNHSLAPSVLFMQYRRYTEQGSSKANTPKEIILAQYADTDYARLIRDPDYYKKLAIESQKLENQYETTYEAFTNKQWKQVISSADQALQTCTDKELRSKFAYLRAVSVGQTQPQEAYRTALQTVLADYGDQRVAELVRILLTDLDPEPVTEQTPAAAAEIAAEQAPFTYTPNDWHYVTLIVNVHNRNVMNLKTDISNFNREFYSLQKFTINSFYISQDEQIVTISRFQNKETALDYYHAICKNEKLSADISAKNIIPYVMSATNYSSYYKKKDIRAQYDDFFQENYLENN